MNHRFYDFGIIETFYRNTTPFSETEEMEMELKICSGRIPALIKMPPQWLKS